MLFNRLLAKIKEEKASLIVLLLIFILLVIISWDKNGIVYSFDQTRELIVPYMINYGKLLYKDIFYIYGPIVPYFMALLTKLFGFNLFVFQTFGLFVILLYVLLIYVLSRLFLNKLDSCFASVLFLTQLAFSNLGAYIFPYTFNASVGGFFFTLLTFLLILYHKYNNRIYLYLSSIIYSIIFFVKQDFFISSSFLIIIFFGLQALKLLEIKQNKQIPSILIELILKIPYKQIFKFYLLAIFIILIGFIFCSEIFSYKAFFEGIFTIDYYNSKEVQFFLQTNTRGNISFINIWNSFILDLVVFAIIISLISFCYFILSLFNKIYIRNRRQSYLFIVLLCTLIPVFLALPIFNGLSILILLIQYFIDHSLLLYAGINLVLFPLLIYLFINQKQSNNLSLILLIFASIFCGFRFSLYLVMSNYPLYYLPLSIILFVYVVVKVLPEIILIIKPLNKNLLLFASRLFLLILAFSYLCYDFALFNATKYKFVSPIGEFYSFNKDLLSKNEMLLNVSKFIKQNSATTDCIQAIPSLVMIYIYSDRLPATKYYEVIPGDIYNSKLELNFINKLKLNKPKFIIISNESFPLYNSGLFGSNTFHPIIYQWITQNYSLYKTFQNYTDHKVFYRVKLYKIN